MRHSVEVHRVIVEGFIHVVEGSIHGWVVVVGFVSSNIGCIVELLLKLEIVKSRDNVFGNILRDSEFAFNLQQLLEFLELPLEAHVREDDRSLLACERKGALEGHVSFLHQIGNHTSSRPADASMAMNQHPSSLSDPLFDESDSRWQVP